MAVAASNPKPTTKDSQSDSKDKARRVIATESMMESEALNFRTRWQENANYIQPRKGNILTFLSPGSPQTILLHDTTAEQALLVYAAGLVSFLTPVGERWFRYQPRDPKASSEIHAWFDTVSEIAAAKLGNSTFYEVWHEDCLDGGCFGNSLMRVDEHVDEPYEILGFTNIPVGTFYWKEDHRGKISTITRKWKWNAMQAAEEFGVENLPPQLLKAYNNTEPSAQARQFTFIEMVGPRKKSEITNGPTTADRRPFECLYVSVEDMAVIREDGHYENPYAGCRTLRSNNEVYGRGPGTQAMPEIKMLNRVMEDVAVITERLAKPSWISPDDTAFVPDNRPDGITYWDASKGQFYKPEQIQQRNDLKHTEILIEKKQQVIRDYFYNDMFKLLTSQEEMQREKTAYEVSQMVAERMILFSPIFGRITNEKLNPILYRVFAILYRNGQLPPLPAGFNLDLEFDVSYVSKIALAIKAIQNQSLATAVQLITTMVQIDPTLVYLLKCQDAARQVFSNAGVPSAWIRSEAEVAALAKAQQDQQARLQAAQAGLAGSQAIKNLGPTAQNAAAKGISSAAGKAA